jgi:hypothetical protein
MRLVPCRRSTTNPASLSTRRCWLTAGHDTSNCAAISPADSSRHLDDGRGRRGGEEALRAGEAMRQRHYQRKLAEGKTRKEALRCLKRRISDAIYARLRADARKAAREGNRGTTRAPA